MPTNEEKQRYIEDAIKTRGWGVVAESMVQPTYQRMLYGLLGPKLLWEGDATKPPVETRVVVRVPRKPAYEVLDKLITSTTRSLTSEMNHHVSARFLLPEPTPVSLDQVADRVGTDPGAVVCNALTFAAFRKHPKIFDDMDPAGKDILGQRLAWFGNRKVLVSPTVETGMFFVTEGSEDMGGFSFSLTIHHRDRGTDPDHVELVFNVEWSMDVAQEARVYCLED